MNEKKEKHNDDDNDYDDPGESSKIGRRHQRTAAKIG